MVTKSNCNKEWGECQLSPMSDEPGIRLAHICRRAPHDDLHSCSVCGVVHLKLRVER